MNARSIITSCNTSCANFSHAKFLWLLMMAFEGDTTSIIMNKKASLRMQVVHLYERGKSLRMLVVHLKVRPLKFDQLGLALK